MPPSGPVYQPTTVTYEQQNDWRPISYLSQTVGNGINRTRCIQWLLLVVGLFALAAGLIMVIEGAVDYSDTKQHEDELGETPEADQESRSDLVIIIGGTILVLLGILFLGLYIRMVRRRKGCPCFPSKEQRLARQLDNQVGNGQKRMEVSGEAGDDLNGITVLLQSLLEYPLERYTSFPPAELMRLTPKILTLNPSTDLLVTAQYGPVSEISYQPPAVSEEEEMRKLMASDNKECVEENERMLEADPRIVLRPRSHVEEA